MVKVGDIIDNPFGDGKVKIVSMTTKFVTFGETEDEQSARMLAKNNMDAYNAFREHHARIMKDMNSRYRKTTEEPKQEDIILVPDNIKIESYKGNMNDMYINNGMQSLGYDCGNYIVTKAIKENEVKCRLITIDVKDLEVGGTYFASDYDNLSSIEDIEMYCKYLGGGKYVNRSGAGLIVSELKRKHRYKISPID